MMADYLTVVAWWLLWMASLLLAYGKGRAHGWQRCLDNERWSRWMLRNYSNRSGKF
jgi:hypothetical protein